MTVLSGWWKRCFKLDFLYRPQISKQKKTYSVPRTLLQFLSQAKDKVEKCVCTDLISFSITLAGMLAIDVREYESVVPLLK